MTQKPIHVIGGGMAGTEATWQIISQGIPVVLHEMRPVRKTDAHQTDGLAELVCSNSFRSDDHEFNAVGLIHDEMRRCNSIIMSAAEKAKVPAGSALAVDREIFSREITEILENHPLVTIDRNEVEGLPPEDWENVIIATGPLTSPSLSQAVLTLADEEALSFFDAIAPIVHKDSINFDIAWMQSRYDKIGPDGDGKDYINCPFYKREDYEAFIQAMIDAEKTEFKEWEKDTPYFEACLPVEIMAERGIETLRFGPMKPVGLQDPRTEEKPYAVVQLRQDNKLGTLYNFVGFQTKMKYGEQSRVFKTIPGLENAEFARLGGIHRNTFLNSPKILDNQLRLKVQPRIRFAGQITGCEGYVESASIGLIVGRLALAEYKGITMELPPLTTAMGALLNHITTGADSKSFQPMNVNFGLFPAVEPTITVNGKRKKIKGKDRKKAYTDRAKSDFAAWLNNYPQDLKVAV